MNQPAEWKTLTEEGDERTEVLRVPGGWLYRTRVYAWERNPVMEDTVQTVVGVAMCHVPERAE